MLKRLPVRKRTAFWRSSLEGVARPFHRFVLKPIARYSQRRAAIAQLSALSDALLVDIGLTRGEIPGAVDRMMSDRRGAPSAWTAYPAVPSSEPVEELRRAA